MAARAAMAAIHASMAMALLERVKLLNNADMSLEDIKSEAIILGLYHLLSYAYYEKDDPLTSDLMFDKLCRLALKRCKASDASPALKKYRDMFRAGTGFGLVHSDFRHPPPALAYDLHKSLEIVQDYSKKRNDNKVLPTKKGVKTGETYSVTGKKKRGRLFK
jgi:NAD-dependent DNA ligase